jgi:hypothetical protein
MKSIKNIFLLLLLVAGSFACDREFEDDLVRDNRPAVPVTYPGAVTHGFNPYYTVSLTGNRMIEIQLAVPANSPLDIAAITKVVGGGTGINAGSLGTGTTLSPPIQVNGKTASFRISIDAYNNIVTGVANRIPATVTAGALVERAFMFSLLMSDGSVIIPTQARIRITP